MFTQLLLLEFDDLRQLFLYVSLEVLDQRVQVDLLVDDRKRSLVLESGANESREQNIFEAFVEEVGKWKIAQFFDYAVLTPLEQVLVLAI